MFVGALQGRLPGRMCLVACFGTKILKILKSTKWQVWSRSRLTVPPESIFENLKEPPKAPKVNSEALVEEHWSAEIN